MPSAVPTAAGRPPRRARYLVPPGTPRRGEVLAAVAVAAVVAGVLFAPVTLVLAAAFDAVSKVSRWRPLWLSVPAAGGILWALAIGPRAAAAGLRRGPAAMAGALSTGPAALTRLPGLVVRGLPGQLPRALILSAGVAALAWWLRWLHTDEWDVPEPRPGLLGAWHQRRAVASLRAGHVLTRDGACLGVDAAPGRAAVLPWRDAGGGVLVTGAAGPAVLGSGLRLACAAIRRRKPVIVVDLTGDRELPGALAGICAAARAPLHVFGGPGGPRYEPRVRPDAEQQAALAAVPWGPRPGAVTGAGLADVVRQRAVVLFALGGPGAGHAAAALAGLIAAGSPAGLAPVLATTAPEPAGRLAGQVNAGIFHRLADPGLAAVLAPLTGTTVVPLSRVLAQHGPPGEDDGAPAAQPGHAVPLGTMEVPVVQAGTLCTLAGGDFVLIAGLAAARAGGAAVTVRARCQTVSTRMPGRPAPPLPGNLATSRRLP